MTTMAMLETYPTSMNLDRAKPAAAIEALNACADACRACEKDCRDLLATIG